MARRSTPDQLAAAKEAGATARVAGRVWALTADQRRIVGTAAPELLEALDVLAEDHRVRMAVPVSPLHA